MVRTRSRSRSGHIMTGFRKLRSRQVQISSRHIRSSQDLVKVLSDQITVSSGFVKVNKRLGLVRSVRIGPGLVSTG